MLLAKYASNSSNFTLPIKKNIKKEDQMKQQKIGFPSVNGTLDGIITTPNDNMDNVPGVVVCHPHPIFGGNMESPVVKQMSSVLAENGITSLRFNFREFPNNDWAFDKTRESVDDLKSAFKTLRNWPNVNNKKIALAGVSFGAAVILKALPELKNVAGVFLACPTVNALRNSQITDFNKPKIVLSGDKDLIAPSKLIYEVSKTIPSLEFKVLTGANHTWESYETKLSQEAYEFFVNIFGR